MTAKANKKGLLMNSKGGIYATLAAVLVIAVMSASMMQVLAVQDDIGVKIAGSAASDVKLAWVNARYLADEGIGRVLYTAALSSCADPIGIDVSTPINATLGGIKGASCTITPASCQSGTDCEFTLKCENNTAAFKDSVSVAKNVIVTLAIPPATGCTVVVTDA